MWERDLLGLAACFRGAARRPSSFEAPHSPLLPRPVLAWETWVGRCGAGFGPTDSVFLELHLGSDKKRDGWPGAPPEGLSVGLTLEAVVDVGFRKSSLARWMTSGLVDVVDSE